MLNSQFYVFDDIFGFGESEDVERLVILMQAWLPSADAAPGIYRCQHGKTSQRNTIPALSRSSQMSTLSLCFVGLILSIF